MKNKYLIFFIAVIWVMRVDAQQGEWTWIHGDNMLNQPGNFGTQGVSDPANKPPAIYEGCEWTDHNGIFWIYGGQHTAGNYYADLWKYDPSINEWTWVKGTGLLNENPVYGVQGVPSPANSPGARGWAPSSWVDASNNLWMFAGCDLASGDMNNLWMYNQATNEWTWMKGASASYSPGNAGTMGVPAITNEPSSRHESTCSWVDPSGDFWMFGGYGSMQFDDLWRYSISTNMWTWIKGNPLASDPPVYGTIGIPDPANTPGARSAYSRWADKTGNLWLWGGVNYIAGSLSDLWKYNIATNEWTWMKGPNFSGSGGSYGTLCVEDTSNNPPVHLENRSCWTDSCGQFWMFAGVLDANAYPQKNDLWKYSPVTNCWTWISGGSGINATGNYGALGVSDPANVPPSRMGSYAWQDLSGNLWTGFGYSNGDYLNDLWRYVPDPNCGACSLLPVAMFSAPNHICPGTCTDFVNSSSGANSFQWTFQGAVPPTSVDQTPVNICYNTPGTYGVTLIASNGVTSDTLTLNNFITVYPYPLAQGISQNGDTLFAIAGAVSYQWYHDGQPVAGATDYFYIAPESGNYNVIATDQNGCEVEAVIFDVVAAVHSNEYLHQLQVYPNPASGALTIQYDGNANSDDFQLTVLNSLGESVNIKVEPDGKPDKYSKGYMATIDVSGLSAGIYWIELYAGGNSLRKLFVKH